MCIALLGGSFFFAQEPALLSTALNQRVGGIEQGSGRGIDGRAGFKQLPKPQVEPGRIQCRSIFPEHSWSALSASAISAPEPSASCGRYRLRASEKEVQEFAARFRFTDSLSAVEFVPRSSSFPRQVIRLEQEVLHIAREFADGKWQPLTASEVSCATRWCAFRIGERDRAVVVTVDDVQHELKEEEKKFSRASLEKLEVRFFAPGDSISAAQLAFAVDVAGERGEVQAEGGK